MSIESPIQGIYAKLGVEFAGNTPVAGGNDTTAGSTNRYYTFFTLAGTSNDLYICTALEPKNGSVVSGNLLCGLDVVDANPPTLANTTTVACTAVTAQAGTSAVQKITVSHSDIIRGGTLLGAWVVSSSAATGKIATTTVGAKNCQRAIAQAAPALTHQTAWTSATEEAYVKAYFKKIF